MKYAWLALGLLGCSFDGPGDGGRSIEMVDVGGRVHLRAEGYDEISSACERVGSGDSFGRAYDCADTEHHQAQILAVACEPAEDCAAPIVQGRNAYVDPLSRTVRIRAYAMIGDIPFEAASDVTLERPELSPTFGSANRSGRLPVGGELTVCTGERPRIDDADWGSARFVVRVEASLDGEPLIPRALDAPGCVSLPTDRAGQLLVRMLWLRSESLYERDIEITTEATP